MDNIKITATRSGFDPARNSTEAEVTAWFEVTQDLASSRYTDETKIHLNILREMQNRFLSFLEFGQPYPDWCIRVDALEEILKEKSRSSMLHFSEQNTEPVTSAFP